MPTTDEPGYIGLTTRLLHSSGEWVEGAFRVPAQDVKTKAETAQAVGSALTYMRRYSLAAALGITQEDDDGNAASQPRQQASRPTPAPPAGISAQAAQRLHAALGVILSSTRYAQEDHAVFASSIVNREITSLTELTTEEAKSVHGAAQVAQQEAA
jgi:hypothetical protein